MPKPNATHAADPAVSRNINARAHSTDASFVEAIVDIPMAPDTIANQKLADPYGTIGTAGDLAGITDAAVREGNSGY